MIAEFTSMAGTSLGSVIANHLWQSTLVAVTAGLLTLILRKNHARTRYWVWLAASLKFLIPFALLIAVGSRITEPTPSPAGQSGLYIVMDEVSHPFNQAAEAALPTASIRHPDLLRLLPAILAAIWLCGFIAVFCTWTVRWRRISSIARAAQPLHEGREVDALLRGQTAAGIRTPIKLLRTQDVLEPGIFGVFRPALLWPASISEHLQDAHLEAILAHELGHVRRRDNLAAAMHMIVEALFWFHPLVWWLGARLVEERERACDEEVLRLGNQPNIYAESILKTCEFCVASSLPCVSGVTGADLKNRIVLIMSQRLGTSLNPGKKLLLSSAAVLAVVGPLVFGLVYATEIRAQVKDGSGQMSAMNAAANGAPLPSFEVASVKPGEADAHNVQIRMSAGRFATKNVSLKMLLQFAYNLKSDDQLSGLPSAFSSKTFDVDAKEDDSPEFKKLPPDQRTDQVRLMLQSLLADRFKLKVSRQTKELPIYALVVAKGGLKMTPATAPPPSPEGPGAKPAPGKSGILMMRNRGEVSGIGVSIGSLSDILSRQPETGGRVVVDKTGLMGNYDWTLKWTPDSTGPVMGGPGGGDASPSDASGPTFFTAVQEQLGLKLESQKGPVEIVVIEHIEEPSAN